MTFGIFYTSVAYIDEKDELNDLRFANKLN